jgi:glycosyltransferase involved in cell wall biosynthesis
MIAFVQPFELHGPGGGARILRSLLDDAPHPYVSICTKPAPAQNLDPELELHLPRRPFFGRIESTRLAKYLHIDKLDLLLGSRFKRRLANVLHEENATAVHAIPHRIDFWHAFEVAQQLGLPYYLNVHDDLTYNLQGTGYYLSQALERLSYVWPRADGRIVISEPMGEEYCQRYGDYSYEVVTDGLSGELPSAPKSTPRDRLHVYFMGALHLTYHPNFQAMFEALERVQASKHELDIAFSSRGSALPEHDTSFATHNLPFATEEEIQRDFERVDMLYLPLPFGEEYESFWRYSLSTKLITYLGSGVPILYHGPKEAAACRLLSENDAAHCVHSLDPGEIVDTLLTSSASRERIAHNALDLGRNRFRREDQRRRFWQVVEPKRPEASVGLTHK